MIRGGTSKKYEQGEQNLVSKIPDPERMLRKTENMNVPKSSFGVVLLRSMLSISEEATLAIRAVTMLIGQRSLPQIYPVGSG